MVKLPKLKVRASPTGMMLDFEPKPGLWRYNPETVYGEIIRSLSSILNGYSLASPSEDYKALAAQVHKQVMKVITFRVKRGEVIIPFPCARCKIDNLDHVGPDQKCPFAPTTFTR